jgi:hypothetical protein
MTFSLRSAGLLLVAGGVALAVGCSGCGPNVGGPKATSTGGATAAADPWPKFVSTVRNNPDPKATRGAVAELTAGLTNAAPADRPTEADPQYVAAVAAALKLTDAEKRFVAGSEFTPLDANHLSECLYLTDVAAGLGVVSADPPAVRADAAFRFVVRQVVLAPSVFVRTGSLLPPVPPTFVLGRGSGTGLERAVAFIALCRQLDLDAYLIGPPQAADQPWTHQGTAADQPPNGPFWAVGVRAAEGVLLFDPWRGEAVPGKAAGRPITLAELKADPSACPWASDKARPWVSADAVKESGLFLSPPLSALAPRMARLQEKLKGGVSVQLAVDWPAAVKAAEAASGEAKAWGWNPPNDKFTPVRVLGSFLPLEQGGLDPTPPQKVESMFFQYDYSRLPIDRLQRPPVAVGNRNAKEALSAMAAVTYREAFLAAPSPREMIQRGQYNAAVGHLLKQQDRFTTQLRGSAADDEALKEWYSNLSGVFNRLTQAQGTADEAAARVGVDKFIQSSDRHLPRAIGGMIGDAVVGEVGYLLALAAHEQAEAAETAAARAEREGGGADARKAAKESWGKAWNGWRRYAPHADSQEVSFPGRKATADALTARAEKLK